MDVYELAREFNVSPLPGHPMDWSPIAIRDFRTLRYARMKAQRVRTDDDRLAQTVRQHHLALHQQLMDHARRGAR